MIEVKELVKKYGKHAALDHLSFTVEKGKVYGLLGANGAGKTTTMNILTGYIGPSSGTVTIDGVDILAHPEEAKQKIGYLPEMPPVYMDMKVEEYLKFSAELKKIPKELRKRRIEETMEKVKLTKVRGRLIKNLSKGYKQRVGLAQALISLPDIIILDEPTVGLDPQQIIEIRSLIRELAQEHTVILSSHILAEVQEVCDYIFIISKGRLIADIPTEDIGQLMHAPKRLKLTVEGTNQQVEGVLKSMAHIVSYEFLPQAERSNEVEHEGNEVTQLTIQPEEDFDIRRELYFAFAEKKQAILEMSQSSTSLEDVFLELIQEDDANHPESKIISTKDLTEDEYEEDAEDELNQEPDTSEKNKDKGDANK